MSAVCTLAAYGIYHHYGLTGLFAVMVVSLIVTLFTEGETP